MEYLQIILSTKLLWSTGKLCDKNILSIQSEIHVLYSIPLHVSPCPFEIHIHTCIFLFRKVWHKSHSNYKTVFYGLHGRTILISRIHKGQENWFEIKIVLILSVEILEFYLVWSQVVMVIKARTCLLVRIKLTFIVNQNNKLILIYII